MATAEKHRKIDRVNHYIPPARKFGEMEKEFVEPNPSDNFIWWLYRYRCAECKQPGQEINEIIPRGRSKNSILDWTNRILLCRHCHDKFHNGGVTESKIDSMKEVRRNYLSMIGRTDYINAAASDLDTRLQA